MAPTTTRTILSIAFSRPGVVATAPSDLGMCVPLRSSPTRYGLPSLGQACRRKYLHPPDARCALPTPAPARRLRGDDEKPTKTHGTSLRLGPLFRSQSD